MAKKRRRRTKVERLVIFLKRILAFLLSHVGLCILVVGFTILGAFVFKAVEGPHEVFVQHTVKDRRRRAVDAMWRATFVHNLLEPQIWAEKVELEADHFRLLLLRCIRRGYDGVDNIDNSQFTMAGAYLYSLTVITTIGYGNIACRTYLGKALTIGYAIIGVPLMLLFLTNIGDVFAEFFTFLYRFWAKIKLRISLWVKRRRFSNLEGVAGFSTSKRHYANHMANFFTFDAEFSGKHGQQNAARLRQKDPLRLKMSTVSFSGLETTPSGKNPAHRRLGRETLQRSKTTLAVSEEPISASANDDSLFSPPIDSQKNHNRRFSEVSGLEKNIRIQRRTSKVLKQRKLRDSLAHDLSAISLSQAEEDIKRKHVPLWLVMFTMVGYLFIGASTFALWEKWDFLEAFYFCFISLTTIGFGDLFPGLSVEVDDRSTQDKLAITSFYLLFGMALIAMCFNLAQEQVVDGVSKLAVRLRAWRVPTSTVASDDAADVVKPID